jgi:predicted dehydrogenase
MSSESPVALRFGLLGTGYWAEHTHAAALAAHPDANFVGVWGRDPYKASLLAKRFSVGVYDEVDALFADVDAVAVALPPDVQGDLAARAAESGRHLLLDKPLAFTVEAADRVVAAVNRHGLSSVVFFTNRFHGNVAARLDQAATAAWDGARATMFSSIFQPGNPYGASVWRGERGGLWDIGPHALSVLLPVLGPVAEVVAVDGPHATAHLLLRHESGQVSSVALTLDAPQAAVQSEVVFYGDAGIMTLPVGVGRSVDAFGTAITELARDVAAGIGTHPCDVRFGREVVAILCAAERSRASGATARVEE